MRIVESEREVRGVLGWGWDGDTLVEAAGWVDGGGVCGGQIGRVVIGGVSENLHKGVHCHVDRLWHRLSHRKHSMRI